MGKKENFGEQHLRRQRTNSATRCAGSFGSNPIRSPGSDPGLNSNIPARLPRWERRPGAPPAPVARESLGLNRWRKQMRRYVERVILAFALAIAFSVTSPPASAQSFTLEQVMGSPFPSELTVSKRGDKIAWVFDAEGKRNLWIAEGPIFAARQLTRYDNDDGQQLSELVFSPAANMI